MWTSPCLIYLLKQISLLFFFWEVTFCVFCDVKLADHRRRKSFLRFPCSFCVSFYSEQFLAFVKLVSEEFLHKEGFTGVIGLVGLGVSADCVVGVGVEWASIVRSSSGAGFD